MSEASSTPAKASTNKAEPRTRRISNPRPKKAAKAAEAASEAAPPAKFPEFPSTAEAPADAVTQNDWPEPEPASSGSGSGQENPKRKRRRKKGKGGGQSQASATADNEPPEASPEASPEAASAAVTQPAPQQARQNQPPRVKIDSEQLAKFAWKIFLAEVSEEGVALVGDNDARELSRRCFRLAEIFLEEQGRRR